VSEALKVGRLDVVWTSSVSFSLTADVKDNDPERDEGKDHFCPSKTFNSMVDMAHLVRDTAANAVQLGLVECSTNEPHNPGPEEPEGMRGKGRD